MLVGCVAAAVTVMVTVVEFVKVPLVPVKPMWKVPPGLVAAEVIVQAVELVVPLEMMLAGVHPTVKRVAVALFDMLIVPVNPFLAVRVRVVELVEPGLLLTIVAGLAAILKLMNLNVRAAVV